MIRVAINGFGRIGRMVFKAGVDDPQIEFVAVNDLGDTASLAYLLKHDSVHGRYEKEVKADKGKLIVDGKEIIVCSERDPENLPWKKLKIDIVVESTGFFLTKELASKHIKAGAKKVLVSAPCKGPDKVKTIVKGVNEEDIKPNDLIISNASCTTNCLAPVVKVLNDNFGIEHGFLTTVHSYTADQNLVDAPHKDFRRGRSAAANIVPTTTGAAKAVTETIPGLNGKLNGIAIRVPTPDGSISDFVCRVKKKTTIEEINALFKNVAEYHLKGVLEYSEEELVSTDIIGNRNSAIFDASMTDVIDGNLIKVLAWYDNEWGYSCRMIDIVKIMGKSI